MGDGVECMGDREKVGAGTDNVAACCKNRFVSAAFVTCRSDARSGTVCARGGPCCDSVEDTYLLS